MIRFDLNMEHDEALMIVFLQKICRLQKTDSASLSQEVN